MTSTRVHFCDSEEKVAKIAKIITDIDKFTVTHLYDTDVKGIRRSVYLTTELKIDDSFNLKVLRLLSHIGGYPDYTDLIICDKDDKYEFLTGILDRDGDISPEVFHTISAVATCNIVNEKSNLYNVILSENNGNPTLIGIEPHPVSASIYGPAQYYRSMTRFCIGGSCLDIRTTDIDVTTVIKYVFVPED